MLQIDREQVQKIPFPHVISDAILDPGIYGALRRDFPNTRVFEELSAGVGQAGSRTGSGFDIYRGDGAYANLLASSTAWRDFDAWINSQAFLDKFVELFGPEMDDLGLKIELDGSTLDPTHVEPRSALTANETLGEKIGRVSKRLTNGLQRRKSVDLFTRLDIEKSVSGYAKPPHCDRANRLCSLIIYFCDADKIGLSGGDLLVYEHKQDKKPRNYERHPRPEDVNVVATLKPKENLGVFFPCSNNSYHGVTAITSNGVERDFIYVNITGRASSIWY